MAEKAVDDSSILSMHIGAPVADALPLRDPRAEQPPL